MTPTHTAALLLCTTLPLSACASYGWADRPSPQPRHRAPVTSGPVIAVETVTAPADRQLDVQRATLALTAQLERCGAARASWGPAPQAHAVVRCHAARAQTRGLDQLLISEVALRCVIAGTRGATTRTIWTRARRSAHASGPRERVRAARLGESEALEEAASRAACPLLRAPDTLADAT